MPRKAKSPVKQYRTIIKDSGDPGYVNRLLVATPSTGQIRMEWAAARYGQIIPTNWSMVSMIQWMNSYIPQRFSVANAQNLIVKAVVEQGFEWLLLIEQDTMPPPDAFVRFNKYMRDATVPVVSGLYYSRSRPAEPLVFRGRGTSFYDKWKMGDKVWVDGVPTGMLLIHAGLLRAMWKESEEYMVGDTKTRRVFRTPTDMWLDEEKGVVNTVTGTSDLDWCTRVMKEGFFKKSGWTKYQNKKYPFLVDTKIFAKHIDLDGTIYP